jgi:hypothetical protein
VRSPVSSFALSPLTFALCDVAPEHTLRSPRKAPPAKLGLPVDGSFWRSRAATSRIEIERCEVGLVGASPFTTPEDARLKRMALAKGATMSRRLEAYSVEAPSKEPSLNLDAIRASLEEAAAVLAEMTDVEASATRHE